MKQLESNLPAVQPASPLIVDAEYEAAPAHVPLAHYLWILRRHGWKMLGFVALVVLCTVVVSLRLTPIYESTATIDIDRRMPTGVLGEDSTQAVNNDADQFLATGPSLDPVHRGADQADLGRSGILRTTQIWPRW